MMMLRSFSAEGMLLSAVVLVLLIGLLVWLVCRKGCGQVSRAAPPLGHRWRDKVDELDADGVLGKPVLEDGVSVVEAADFSFADEREVSKSEKLGLVADVRQEIVVAIEVLAKNDGNKEDFFSMMAMVRAKYPKISGHAATAELSRFIRDHVPFHFSADELENLWG